MTLKQILNLLEKEKELFSKEEYEIMKNIISKKLNNNEIPIYEKAMNFKNEGNILFKNKEYKKSIQKYNEAIKLIDDNEIFYSNRAACYQSLNQLDKAIKDCNKAIKLNSSFIKAYIRLGSIYLIKGDRSKSLSNYEKVLTLDSDNQTAKEALNKLMENPSSNETKVDPAQDSNFEKKIQELIKENPELYKKAEEFMKNGNGNQFFNKK